MEEELLQVDDLKEENESMHQQLADLKAEAESSRLADNKMYQLLQELKQEKQLHDQWERKETIKVQILAKEGHSWSTLLFSSCSFKYS
jgi:hypothetical protein